MQSQPGMSPLSPLHDVRSRIIETARAIIGGKGFAAVGLNEILQSAGVPKGSFYHYFGSKEAFGEALLQAYFADYMDRLEIVLTQPGLPASDRLMNYWQHWLETQANHDDPKGKCLTVKLSAEVSDLSESMRVALRQGTDGIIRRLARCIEEGMAEGSLASDMQPAETAAALYHLWLGASLRAKITRDRVPLELALASTRRLLGIATPPMLN